MTSTPDPAHWDAAYDQAADKVSWHQEEAAVSLDLIERADLRPDDPIIDIGGGASPLAGALLERGFRDLSVLDVSERALDTARTRLGARAEHVAWIRADLRSWMPERAYALWHDRAVLHFLTTREDQHAYAELVAHAVSPGGHAIIATFAPDGPQQCSGLPVQRYGRADLAALLGGRFVIEETRREDHVTPGGAVQPFTWVAASHL